jgi:hypothetical protein
MMCSCHARRILQVCATKEDMRNYRHNKEIKEWRLSESQYVSGTCKRLNDNLETSKFDVQVVGFEYKPDFSSKTHAEDKFRYPIRGGGRRRSTREACDTANMPEQGVLAGFLGALSDLSACLGGGGGRLCGALRCAMAADADLLEMSLAPPRSSTLAPTAVGHEHAELGRPHGHFSIQIQ